MAEHCQFLIVGAGPTGLGAAWRLQELGRSDWRLIESSTAAGGLAASVVDDQGFTWDMGGHVIFSHYDYFDQLLDQLLGEDWLYHVREASVWLKEQFVPYPFQNNIWRLPQEDLVNCLDGLLYVYKNGASGARPANFEEWIVRSFGQGLADIFFLPYNRKVWAYEPADLSTCWMGERVATADLKTILHNIVYQKDDIGWGPNAQFRFPKYGGTGAIWRALANRLPADRLAFDQTVAMVDSAKRELTLENGERITYDHLISTMPLDTLLTCLSDLPNLTRRVKKFKYSSSHIVGVGIDGQAPEPFSLKCWMYFPESDIPFYRATIFSNYSPNNVPKPGKQWSVMCEVSESPGKKVDSAQVAEQVVIGLKRARIIDDATKIVSLWHRRLEHGYPTPFLERDALLEEIEPRLRDLSIYTRGRFGGWKYEVANQDHSFMQGVELVEHLLFGAEETTYFYPQVANSGGKVKARHFEVGRKQQ